MKKTRFFYGTFLMLCALMMLQSCEKPGLGSTSTKIKTVSATEVTGTSALLTGEIGVEIADYKSENFGMLISEEESELRLYKGMKISGARLIGQSFSVKVYDLSAETKYYYRAYLILDGIQEEYGEVKSFKTEKDYCSTTVLSTAGRVNCECVQLWKNGPKWATFNVGATITDYANLTEGVDATSFYNNEDEAPYYNTANCGGLYAWNQPNCNGRQTTWASNVSTGVADVATTLWGRNWKTPTVQQLDTLQNSSYGKTFLTWCDGVNTQYVPGCTLKGYKVSGVGEYADKSIFLPAAGYLYYNDGTIRRAGEGGYYWMSKEYDSLSAYILRFYSLNNLLIDDCRRKEGLSIRAVLVE